MTPSAFGELCDRGDAGAVRAACRDAPLLANCCPDYQRIPAIAFALNCLKHSAKGFDVVVELLRHGANPNTRINQIPRVSGCRKLYEERFGRGSAKTLKLEAVVTKLLNDVSDISPAGWVLCI
jgi:hypothetical protein